MTMQINSNYKGCTYHKSEVPKENKPPDPKLNNGKCRSAHRYRAFPKSRMPKQKLRYSHGNHHRLDHTYAADSKAQQLVKETASVKDETDDINLKSSWLRNLCLEYQPSKNVTETPVSDSRFDDSPKEKYTPFRISVINGTLKQYQRNRKISKTKAQIGRSKFGRTGQEDKKRWIAALALIELAQSK